MGTVTIAYHSEMTLGGAMQVFRSHFGSKYDVYGTRFPAADFVAKESGWTGRGDAETGERGHLLRTLATYSKRTFQRAVRGPAPKANPMATLEGTRGGSTGVHDERCRL